MTLTAQEKSVTTKPSHRGPRALTIAALTVGSVLLLGAGCDSGDEDSGSPGTGGSESGGSAGESGMGGTGGTSGAGTGGSSGETSGGEAGEAGGPSTGGAAGSSSGRGGSSGSAGNGGSAGDGGSGGDGELGTVVGRVFNARTLTPLSGVTVSIGDGSTTTNADGVFELDAEAGGNVVLALGRDGFATGFEPVRVLEGLESHLEAYLLPVTTQGTLVAEAGGTVGNVNAKIEVPANAFVDARGMPVTGDVDVTLTVLNPGVVEEMLAFPGDFAATNSAGSDGLLETFVPMDISVQKDGTDVALAEDATIRVTFPVFDPAAAPPTIATWSLDEATGHWVEEGTASLVVRNGARVYETEITHLSWWNCDAFSNSITCVRGCVTDDGMPAPGASVRARGITFANVGTMTAGPDGCFAGNVPRGAMLEIRAFNANGRSIAHVVTAGSTPLLAETNPAACQDVGELAIESGGDACPAGYELCGQDCVDFSNDISHCGGCSSPCAGGGDTGGGVTGASCIDGECACKNNQTLCGTSCISTKSDRANCGACNRACPNGERCESGQCVAIVCGPDLTLCTNDCVDTETNASHCGACNASCGGGEGGRQCVEGTCGCPSGLTTCNGACVDTSNNRSHCGACGVVCGTGTECRAGTCQAITCKTGLTLCGNTCVDTLTSRSHCGACNMSCGGGEGSALQCVNGLCG